MIDAREPLLAYLEKPSRRRFARVVRTYQDHVWTVAHRVAGNEDDAADIAQDVFLELLDAAPAAGSVRSPRGYLAWRVITRASRMRRSAERRRAREAENLRRVSAVGEVGLVDAEALRAALAELPEELRVPVELRYFSGLHNAEIAGLVGLPLRTLESRLAEARESLRRKLAPLVLSTLLAGPDAPAAAAPAALRARLARVAAWGAALSAGNGAKSAVIAGGSLVVPKGAVTLAAVLALAFGGYATLVLRDPGKSFPVGPADPTKTVVAADPAGQEASAEIEALRAAERPRAPQTARLTGAVRDEDGRPIAGARVRFYDNISEEHAAALRSLGHESAVAGDLKRDAESGPDGEFAFEGLFPGEARVGAKAEGFFSEGQYELELVAGKETRQELVLKAPRRLTGSVKDTAGQPVPGAAVLVRQVCVRNPEELEGVGTESLRFVAFRTDFMGRYETGPRLEKIPRGGSEILAWADGFGMSIKPVEEAPEPHGREAVLDFVLGPERPLLLRVRDTAGAPISGAQVGAGDATSRHGWVPYPLCLTDALGIARVSMLSREEQRLSVRKEGFHSVGIVVAPDGPEEMAVVLEPLGALLEARIVYDERIPETARKNVEVWLVARDASGKQRLWEQSREWTGMIHTFRPRESGKYSFAYRPAGVTLETDSFDFDPRKPLVVEIPVRLAPPFIEGVVQRAGSDEPIAGAEVIAFYLEEGEDPGSWSGGTFLNGFFFPGMPGRRSITTTDGKGRFLILLPSVEKALHVTLTAGGMSHGWAREVSLDLEREDKVAGAVLELEPSGQIEGRVLSLSKEPVTGRIVAAYDGGRSLRWRITDTSGRFFLDNLRPGPHALEVLGSGPVSVGHGGGGTPCPGLLPSPAEVFDLRVEVRAGETTARDLILEEDSLGIVEGRIAEGLPRDGEVRHVLRIDGVRCPTAAFEGTTWVVGGRFRIEHLLPGTYGLYFSRKREPGLHAWSDVTVERGSIVECLVEDRSGLVVIPLGAAGDPEGLQVKAKWGESPSALRENVEYAWTSWPPPVLEASSSSMRVLVPEGVVRIGLRADGFPEVWTEELAVKAGNVTEASTIELRAARLQTPETPPAETAPR